jgi:hypothetical protein
MNKKLRLFGRLILFALPFSVFVVVYAVTDPYMVLYKYNDYNRNYYINKNRDYVSTEMFLRNSGKYDFDSFIFGSSTSMFIPPSLWGNYIETDNYVFSFDASRERLQGIWSKVKYLDQNGIHIKNSIVILESKTFTEFVNNIPLFMKHYEVYPSSKLYFQYAYFLNFCDLRFLVALGHYRLTEKFHPYMSEFLVSEPYSYDTVTNEFYNPGIMDELKRDSIGYYEARKDNFPPRSGTFIEEAEKLTPEHVEMLNEIRDIFVRHQTDYRIIICPTYNQREFNHKDLKVLKSVFGEQTVFDFTGINRFTEEKSMYYDEFHFKELLGKEMLDSVYTNQAIKFTAY